MDDSQIEALLNAWHAGDLQALAKLLDFDRDWMTRLARRVSPNAVRAKDESSDIVQGCTLRLLRYRPEFPPSNLRQFRALVTQTIQQVVLDRARHHGAEKRVPTDRIAVRNSEIDKITQEFLRMTPPTVRAEQTELRARMALALELLDPDDRKVIELRTVRGSSFPAIATELGLNTGAATMRYQRAATRLRQAFSDLQPGEDPAVDRT